MSARTSVHWSRVRRAALFLISLSAALPVVSARGQDGAPARPAPEQVIGLPAAPEPAGPHPHGLDDGVAPAAPVVPITPVAPIAPAAPPLINDLPAHDGPTLEAAAEAQLKVDEPTDLWDRIRRGFSMPNLEGPLVERNERFYASKPEHVRRVTERASRYLYHIVEEIERRGMPTEIALLPFIESAFNPQALSPAKASGMWQFIPDTGRRYGLKQNMFTDERRDVLESTRAALDYLGSLYSMFGDWHLAFAAYNWGEGAVQRAIERNRRAGKPTDYASLRMPDETRSYVPRLQAVKNIIADPAAFNLDLPPVENEEYFTTVSPPGDIDVHRAAQLAGMSIDEFRALNPSFKKPVIVSATMPQLVVPKDRAEQFLANLDFSSGSLSSFTAHTVQARDSLDSIAKQYHTSVAELRDLNGIPNGARPKAGATLLVPRPAGMAGDIPSEIAENARLDYELDRVVQRRAIKVRAGDTLASVAKRHRVSIGQLGQWNGLSSSTRLQAGQTLFIEQVVAKKSGNASGTSAGSQKAAKKNTTAKRGARPPADKARPSAAPTKPSRGKSAPRPRR